MKLGIIAAVTLAVGVLTAWAEEVQIQGKLGCSHCAYHVAQTCGVALKTADGKIYTIVDPDKDLMKARMKNAEVKLTGEVVEKGDSRTIKVTKTEIVK